MYALVEPQDTHRRLQLDGLARCSLLIKRAVLTHDSLPRAIRHQALASHPDVIQETADAYGYTDIRPSKFNPTPRDISNWLPVFGWLCWIRGTNNGGRSYKVLVCRARNVSWWKLAQRFGRSERTVQRYHDGAVSQIYNQFDLEVWATDLPKSIS